MKTKILFLLSFVIALFAVRVVAEPVTQLDGMRCLLMNDDTNPACPIQGQNYTNTTVTTDGSYWVHEDEGADKLGRDSALLTYLKHTLKVGGKETWYLNNARAGAAYRIGYNYIPYSSTSDAISSSKAYQVNLRNKDDSFVQSPAYEEGIGTLYFDAVNRLTDANGLSAFVVEYRTGEEAKTFDTSTNGIWKCVDVSVYVVSNGVTTMTPVSTGLTNSVYTATKSAAVFFRCRATINTREWTRFRIRRIVTVSIAAADTATLVLDNIVAAYPSASAELTLASGASSFSPAYPYAGCPNITSRCAVTYMTNNWASSVTVTNFVTHYRWRYLSNDSQPWLAVTNTGPFEANTSVVTSGDVVLTGIRPDEGDLEYYFTGNYDCKYYNPVDFTGTGAAFGGDTDVLKPLKLRGNIEDQASKGTDYFVRLRPAYSPYGAFIIAKNDDFSDNSVTTMRLIGDHQWEGLMELKTTDKMTNMVTLCGVNRTADDADTFATNAAYWTGTGHRKDLPDSGGMNGPSTIKPTDPMTVEVDPATCGYLRITFNDETFKYSIARAEYQNFNTWTDSMKYYMETGGVARTKLDYYSNFLSNTVSSANDSYWYETFENDSPADYPETAFFDQNSTPRGWQAENAVFTAYRMPLGGAGIDVNKKALRLSGGESTKGIGTLSYMHTNGTHVVGGIDTVTFNAHIAQPASVEGIAYRWQALNTQNYEMRARISMAETEDELSPEEPTVSLIGYYRPAQGFYELRITRIPQANAGRHSVMQLYRWRLNTPNGVPQFEKLGTDVYLSHDFVGAASAPVVRFQLVNVPAGTTLAGTRLIAGVSTDVNAAFNSHSNMFTQITFMDTSDERRTAGMYGVLSSDCAATFTRPQGLLNVTSEDPTWGVSSDHNVTTDWIYQDQRYGTFWTSESSYGFKVKVPSARLMIAAYSTEFPGAVERNSQWQTVIDSFGMQSLSIPVHSITNCRPVLSIDETFNGLSSDVVIDDVKFTQWRGQTPTYDAWGLSKSWVPTQGWINENGTARSCTLHTGRADPDRPLSVRSPLVNPGLSMVRLTYTDATPNIQLLVQVATNAVTEYNVQNLSEQQENGIGWTTVEKLSFPRGGAGTKYAYFSYRSPVTNALLRLIVPTTQVRAARASATSISNPQITLTSVTVWNEPDLDTRAWWGWNIRCWNDTDPVRHNQFLWDGDNGMSGFLNNTSNGDTLPSISPIQMEAHKPFLQTPEMKSGIGSISFRAKQWTVGQEPVVSIYRADTVPLPDADVNWKLVTKITVTSDVYQVYSYRLKPVDDPTGTRALRLVTSYDSSQRRVSLDEVVVSEQVVPRVRITEIRPFRTGLDRDTVVDDIMAPEQQPLAGEEFGLQVALEVPILAEEIDFDSIKVSYSYYPSETPGAKWGYSAWKTDTRTAVHNIPMVRAEGTNLVFRTDMIHTIPGQEDGTVVQFQAFVEFKDKNGSVGSSSVQPEDYTRPSWYQFLPDSNEYNTRYAGFSPYCIIDKIAPYRVWVNEINYRSESNTASKTNQYVEIAIPADKDIDLSGWELRSLTYQSSAGVPIYRFGNNGNIASKTIPSTNHYAFITLAAEGETPAVGINAVADGHLNLNALKSLNGKNFNFLIYPYAFYLVRPNGICEFIPVADLTPASKYYCYDVTQNYYQSKGFDEAKQMIYAGCELSVGSLGVTTGVGRVNAEWAPKLTEPATNVADIVGNVTMTPTPGAINRMSDNTVQIIPQNYYFLPNGTNVFIYSYITGGGFQNGTNTTEIIMKLPQGSSTNIVYTAEPWYRVESLVSNGVTVVNAVEDLKEINLAFNNLQTTQTVNVVFGLAQKVRDAGLDPNNNYADEIVKWLQDMGETDTFELLKMSSYGGEASAKTIDLLGMYWLDIAPTNSWWLYGGITAVNPPDANTNITLDVYLMLSNCTTKTCSKLTHLQGKKNIRSDTVSIEEWKKTDGPAFKVLGHIPGILGQDWVFINQSLLDARSFDNNYRARIVIRNPFSPNSYSGGTEGWMYHANASPMFKWRIEQQFPVAGYEYVSPADTNALHGITRPVHE